MNILVIIIHVIISFWLDMHLLLLLLQTHVNNTGAVDIYVLHMILFWAYFVVDCRGLSHSMDDLLSCTGNTPTGVLSGSQTNDCSYSAITCWQMNFGLYLCISLCGLILFDLCCKKARRPHLWGKYYLFIHTNEWLCFSLEGKTSS